MWHAHKCRECGTYWEHQTCETCTNEEYHELHNCPNCGVNERSKVRIVGDIFDYPHPIGVDQLNA